MTHTICINVRHTSYEIQYHVHCTRQNKTCHILHIILINFYYYFTGTFRYSAIIHNTVKIEDPTTLQMFHYRQFFNTKFHTVE